MAWRLLHSWWHADRIRVSPAAGKLLRLKPPCCLHLLGQYVEVVDSAVLEGRSAVVYGCRTRTGLGTLVVEFGAAGLAVEWREGSQLVRLAGEDVEIFSR